MLMTSPGKKGASNHLLLKINFSKNCSVLLDIVFPDLNGGMLVLRAWEKGLSGNRAGDLLSFENINSNRSRRSTCLSEDIPITRSLIFEFFSFFGREKTISL